MYFYFRSPVFLFLFIMLLACQPEDIETLQPEDELADVLLADEYFKAKIDGKDWIAVNHTSSSSGTIKAKIYTWTYKNKNRYSALKIRASIEENGKNVQAMGGFIQKYYGPGVYYIGTNRNQNYCHYFDHGVSWNSDIYRGNIGAIKINVDTGDHIEGVMNYRAFNANDPSKSKLINAEFKAFYEE